MHTLALFTLIATSWFYLGSRALITRWLWSRYPPGFAKFADCPACTGFWFGVFLSLVLGGSLDPVFVGNLDADPITKIVLEAILVGFSMLVLTPLGAGLMQHALEVVGSVVDTDSQEG